MRKSIHKEIFQAIKSSPTGSVIKIFGLSMGIAIFIFIMLYAKSEYGVNKSCKDFNNIYRMNWIRTDGKAWPGTPAKVGELLYKNLPEIRSFARVYSRGSASTAMIDNTPMKIGRITYVDSSFFKLFSLPLKYGNDNTCLKDKFSLVITETLSERLFGDEMPVGKTVRINNKFEARITGVIYDFDRNTHIQGEAFMSFYSIPDIRNWPGVFDSYGSYDYQTYLLLGDNNSLKTTTQRINNYLTSYAEEYAIESLMDDEYSLSTLNDVYFAPEESPVFRKGNIRQLNILITTGVLILIVAIINYVNLTTAHTGYRLKHVFVRRILGASQKTIFFTIVYESIIIAVISLILGLGILIMTEPVVESTLGYSLVSNYLNSFGSVLILIIAGVIIGVISGIYPAVLLTGLSGSNKQNRKSKLTNYSFRIRKTMTFLQIFISVVLIGITFVFFSQLKYTETADLGFDKESLVYMPVNSEIKARREAFKEELLKHQGIENVTFSYGSFRTSTEQWSLDYNDERVLLHIESIDENYINTLGLNLIEGRNPRGIQDKNKMIVNEEAVRQYFGSNPVGTLIGSSSESPYEIIGVVKDFKYLPFDRNTEPIAMLYEPAWVNLCIVNFGGDHQASLIQHMKQVWDEFCHEAPFDYMFVSDLYSQKYTEWKSISKLLFFFSAISIIIASLGVYGLAAFSVQKRSREIGVRKVNGASIRDIILLLSSEINLIVIFTIVPAFSAILFFGQRWLSKFAYHIDFPIWALPVSFLIVWLVAFISSAGKSFSTALINPVKVLRTD